MSCGQIALNRIGIIPTTYYAAEIDKYAITATQHNYPDTIQLGDINNWRDWDIEWSDIDLVLAGAPCQSFSNAGKGGGFTDPRGQLIHRVFEIIAHIKHANHDMKFLVENVKMKQSHMDVISSGLGVNPVEACSSLVSAQLRKRNYWCNWGFNQPEDKGLILGDIIMDGHVDRGKSYCIDANYHKGTNLAQYRDKGRRQIVYTDNISLHGKVKTHVDGNGGAHYRKLTPIECAKLQTVPLDYLDVPGISNTQKYKMLGNGWTIDMITHIFKAGL